MDVRSLGYVVIESADPTKWLEYGRDILGLMPAPNMPDDGNVYLKLDERPFRFAIVKGEQERLQRCGWELRDREDFADAKPTGICRQIVRVIDCELYKIFGILAAEIKG